MQLLSCSSSGTVFVTATAMSIVLHWKNMYSYRDAWTSWELAEDFSSCCCYQQSLWIHLWCLLLSLVYVSQSLWTITVFLCHLLCYSHCGHFPVIFCHHWCYKSTITVNASLLSHIISYHHWHHNPCKYIHVHSSHHQCHNLFSALSSIMLLLVLDEKNHNLWDWQIVQSSLKSFLKLSDGTVLDEVISETVRFYSPWWSHLWKWQIVQSLMKSSLKMAESTVLDEVISENGW